MKLTKSKRIKLIGTKCVVKAIYEGKPQWEIKEIKPRPAWITGFGVIRRGTPEYLGYDEGHIFNHEKTIKVIKIRFWPTEKEFNAPYEHITFDENVEPYPSQALFADECKKHYHEQKELFPRNEKGQFVKLYKD